MGLIRKPSQLEVKATLSALIYGQPGIGKTTLGCSAPNPVLFDFDGGVGRVNGAHQCDCVQIHSWQDCRDALQEVKTAGCYLTIVIDTIGKMLSYMEEHIKETQPKMKQKDGSLSLKGYGVRKQMFVQFLKDLDVMGINVLFIAHESEQKRGDEVVVRPEISGSACAELIKELDLVGYMQAYGKERTISFDPCESYYAKNTCSMAGVVKIPVVVDDEGNAIGSNEFFSRVIQSYQDRQRKSIATTHEYEQLIIKLKDTIANITTAEDANAFGVWITEQSHIYNSMAVSRKLFAERVRELGLTYNKMTKEYGKAS